VTFLAVLQVRRRLVAPLAAEEPPHATFYTREMKTRADDALDVSTGVLINPGEKFFVVL
jgi:hypothetical protein